MNLIILIVSILTILFGIGIGLLIIRRRPRKRPIKTEFFEKEWRELQIFCRSKDTWADALLAADSLLDKALKKKRFKGKRMGERLVAAQRYITDNDDVWDAHNLVKKIVEKNGDLPLKESQVKETLISFRLALIDLEALPSVKPKDS